MKALVRRRYGSPDQIKIEFTEKPIPTENEVLIRVHATIVKRTDCANLTAKPFGGIGSALLQFVRQYDVKITATCDSKNIKLIQSLGADKIYDYTKEDFTDANDKYDFIFDALSKSTFGKCKGNKSFRFKSFW